MSTATEAAITALTLDTGALDDLADTTDTADTADATDLGAFFDEEFLTWFDRETGEVLRTEEAAPDTGDIFALAAHVGTRLESAEAQLAGLVAERDARLARVALQYDRAIQRRAKYIEWLKSNPEFREPLREWARGNLKGKSRSVQLGALTLAFHRTPGKLEVQDKEQAIVWARTNCPEAIKVTESFLVSKVPSEIRTAFIESEMIYPAEECGLAWIPAYDKFEVK